MQVYRSIVSFFVIVMLYGHHHDFANRYGVSVSQMTTDMFRLS